jgi:hypothetical protein
LPSPGPGGLTGSLPKEVLLRVWRGVHPTRSGEVVYVPAGWNFMDGGVSHSVPWPYMQRVPMLWYGPGVIRSQAPLARPVTSADIAPTLALLTRHRFDAPDGAPMEEILEPDAKPPRLVIVFVWDGAGRHVLDLWPDEWPNLGRMAPKGTWYENATVGSSPSTTAPIHATMGTGAFPRRHGVVDSYVRRDNGVVGDAWTRGPGVLLLPTFADDYGEATRHRARIGILASLTWHLGMMGRGRQADPRSTQLAVLRPGGSDTGAEGERWSLPVSAVDSYRFPEYMNDLPPVQTYIPEADASDGKVDGTWMGHPFEELNNGFHSPARVPFQQRALEEVILREGFGQDEIPDLLFVNSKFIDWVGHQYTATGAEMGAAVRAQDAALPGFVEFLDRTVGRGRWAFLLTADHGHTPHPDVSGGFRMGVKRLEALLTGLFPGGDPVVERVRLSWAFLNEQELVRRGADLAAVSAFVADLTKEQLALDSSDVAASDRSQRPFAAAVPAAGLVELIAR